TADVGAVRGRPDHGAVPEPRAHRPDETRPARRDRRDPRRGTAEHRRGGRVVDTITIDLVDPATYTEHKFEPMFDWLRRNAPVYWHEEREGPGFWALTKHRDIAAGDADAEQFSSAHGMRLDSDPVAVAQATGRMISSADPPTHTQLKKAMLNAFTPRAVR